jgi:hypothetical protein
VFDEAVYYSLHMFSQKQNGWEWSIVSTGDSPVTYISHPWQETPEYFDPHLADIRSGHLTPRCTQSSSTYLTVTTMYNGLQKGHEEVYGKVEVDARYLRVIVDFASLPDPPPVFARRPYALLETPRAASQTPVDIREPYPLVFTAFANELQRGQILKIRWSMAWRGRPDEAVPQVGLTAREVDPKS